MSTKFHMGLSVRGVLSWDDSMWREQISIFETDDGRRMSRDEVTKELLDHLQQGHTTIPMTKECDHFDYTEGCLGHPS